ncbi:MAG TPA: peptidylprolyl isomerase [Thermoleophilia bacterium]|nr:peptidylprolyl isomerase [Thermoleophilia bacterium]
MIRSSRLGLPAFVFASCAAFALLLVACGGSAGPSPSPTADRVAGVVNGQDLRASSVGVVLAERRLLGQSAAGAFKEAVDRELVRQEAARLGVTADAAAVDKRIAALTTQMGGAAALKKSLAAAKVTPAQLRQSITDGVLRQAVQDALFPKVTVGQGVVRAYYQSHVKDLFTRGASVHLDAIPVRARLIAENALKRLRQGHPFAEVARQFSIDPESKANGGDMGWVTVASLPAPLQKVVTGAKAGVVARPIAAAGGWYVLDVIASQPAQVLSFAKVRLGLQAELTRVERSHALDGWLAAARKKASIQQK